MYRLRAWDIDQQEMFLCPKDCDNRDLSNWIEAHSIGGLNGFNREKTKDSVLMMGIEFLDEQKIEIFEGDIVRCKYFNEKWFEKDIVVSRASDLILDINGSLKIVGNIYENQLR